MLSPGNHRVEDDRGAEHDRELVVTRREPAPLLDITETPLDDVPALVIGRVEHGRPATTRAATLPVRLLVARLGEHRTDSALAQTHADRARGIRLVAPDRVGPGAGTPDRPRNTKPLQQRQQRLRTLKLGFLILAGISLAATIPASRLPRYRPEEIPVPAE